MIVTADHRVLLKRGAGIQEQDAKEGNSRVPALYRETIGHWYFIAPVFSETQLLSEESKMFLQTQHEHELLGYVMVGKRKSGLHRAQTYTVLNNIGITMVSSVLLLLVLRRSFSRLTRPLNDLSEVMGRAQEGKEAYAKLEGPNEVVRIATAFNKMKAALDERDQQLRQHNVVLERQVAERTQELSYALEMAVQANRNKSYFLSSVSHELRTPLQSIIGYSDLILDGLVAEDDQIRHDIETILRNATNLLNMINSILDMAKIESGAVDVSLSMVDLESVATQAIETIKPLLTENGNVLETDLRIDRRQMLTDEAKIRQIMLNLIGNATKFTHRGKVRFEVATNENGVEMVVADTGIGMSEEQLTRIFEPFYQAEGGLTRRFQGTGLGLAISKQFAQALGGDIRVESKLGAGTRFYVSIPYAKG
ncbi:MAG: ATP-binding protein [Pseudomonadota bacterium]